MNTNDSAPVTLMECQRCHKMAEEDTCASVKDSSNLAVCEECLDAYNNYEWTIRCLAMEETIVETPEKVPSVTCVQCGDETNKWWVEQDELYCRNCNEHCDGCDDCHICDEESENDE